MLRKKTIIDSMLSAPIVNPNGVQSTAKRPYGAADGKRKSATVRRFASDALGAFILTAIVLSSSVALCQDMAKHDGGACPCSTEIAELGRRIDSLEARLENQQIQIVESNPLKSGKYLQWGKGLTLAMTKSQYRLTAEAGYTFLTPKSYRMGIFLGHDAQFGTDCAFPYAAFYGKAAFGTPVFINFISLNGNFRTLYYPKFAQRDIDQTDAGIGVGAELEFWFKPTFCYTFGGSFTTMRYRTSINYFNLNEINFIGFKYYPQFKKKKTG